MTTCVVTSVCVLAVQTSGSSGHVVDLCSVCRFNEHNLTITACRGSQVGGSATVKFSPLCESACPVSCRTHFVILLTVRITISTVCQLNVECVDTLTEHTQCLGAQKERWLPSICQPQLLVGWE